MKPKDIYSSYLLVAGLMLLLLGIGNWIVGAVQITKYQRLLRNTAKTGLEESYRNFQELDLRKNEEVLRRINKDREKYNTARVNVDFYYVVLGGGRLLFFIGLFLTFFGLIRLIRKDASIKIGRLNSRLLRRS
ncbi:MAG: hypothetical protein IH856_06265 [Deltaproteobacteria bacterium]|nr:hypothetical protein [Deltaproteobacteria bacterium]MCZ6548186.1 hypothetical protein [Deltaproteobacteria bacterium]MCZ6562678.1 hypothetical protein [Deltaproteobacteria bacterium]